MKRKLLFAAALAAGALGFNANAQKALLTAEKGWKGITELPADVNQYFFALYDHSGDLGLVMKQGVNQKDGDSYDFMTMWYEANVNPETDKTALWTFISVSDYHVVVNATNPDRFLQQEWGKPYFFHTSDNGNGDPVWGGVKPAYADGSWTILNNREANNYLGPWNAGAFEAGAEVALNKTADGDIGHFDIYAITRGKYVQNVEDLESATIDKPINISYVITDNGAELKYADRKAIDLAWTKTPSNVTIQTRDDNGLANKDGRVYMESWENDANGHTLSDRGLSQTIADLPTGIYKLTVLTDATAAGAFLYAGEDKVELNTNVDGVATLTFEVGENSEPLEYGVKLEGYQSNWIKFDKFQLYYCGKDVIDEEEIKQNLQELLVEAEKITLGFDEGEYAPYKNVAFVQAYGKAKQIAESTEDVDISVYVDTYNELKSAMEEDLVKNETEVNAVYDGTFANAVNDGAPLGWTMSNNTLGGATHSRAFVGDNRLSEFNETGSGFFVRFDGFSSDAGSMYYYGKTDGYTMPLKADTYYTLSLDFANWADGGTPEAPFKVNVSGPENFVASKSVTTTKNANLSSNTETENITIIFKTVKEGNYEISFQNPGASNQHNVIVSNITLCRTTPTVEVTDAGYATYVTPMDVDFGDEVEAYIVKEVTTEDGEAAFAQLSLITEAPANTPVIIKADKGEYKLTVIAEAKEVEGENLLKISDGKVTAADNIFVLAKFAEVGFYPLASDYTLPSGKVYLEVPEEGAGVKFIGFGDGNATGINGVENAVIYNVAGQRVSNPTKGGIYIINGKKVLVK